MKVRWIVYGVIALWEIPSIILGIWTTTPLCLLYPLMGSYPWSYAPEAPDFLVIEYLWGILSFAFFGFLALVAIRKNSMLLGGLFALLLSLSSLLVIMRVLLLYVH
jgi:hypothetical protein